MLAVPVVVSTICAALGCYSLPANKINTTLSENATTPWWRTTFQRELYGVNVNRKRLGGFTWANETQVDETQEDAFDWIDPMVSAWANDINAVQYMVSLIIPAIYAYAEHYKSESKTTSPLLELKSVPMHRTTTDDSVAKPHAANDSTKEPFPDSTNKEKPKNTRKLRQTKGPDWATAAAAAARLQCEHEKEAAKLEAEAAAKAEDICVADIVDEATKIERDAWIRAWEKKWKCWDFLETPENDTRRTTLERLFAKYKMTYSSCSTPRAGNFIAWFRVFNKLKVSL